jgi:hypothetical protein
MDRWSAGVDTRAHALRCLKRRLARVVFATSTPIRTTADTSTNMRLKGSPICLSNTFCHNGFSGEFTFRVGAQSRPTVNRFTVFGLG